MKVLSVLVTRRDGWSPEAAQINLQSLHYNLPTVLYEWIFKNNDVFVPSKGDLDEHFMC